MKRIIPVLALILAAFLSVATCTSQQGKSQDYTDPGVLSKLIAGKDPYYLLDVRTPEEYAEGHIGTALNTPLADIPANLPTMKKDDLVIVYCRSGARSAQAYKKLADMGFLNLYDFGGINRWTGKTKTGISP